MAFIVLMFSSRTASAACASAADCMGGQLCQAGMCVGSPPPVQVEPALPTQAEIPSASPTSPPTGSAPAGGKPSSHEETSGAAVPQPPPAPYPAPTYSYPQDDYRGSPPPAPASAPVPSAAGVQSSDTSFGNPGQLVFWGGFGGTLSSATSQYSNGGGANDSSTININPTVGYFLSNLLVLEAGGSLWRNKDTTVTYYGFGLEAGLGFHSPVGDTITFLPELRLGGGWSQYDYPTTTDQAYGRYWASVGMPILFHIAPHFFLGAGPVITKFYSKLTTAGSDTYETTRLTLQFSVGGWI